MKVKYLPAFIFFFLMTTVKLSAQVIIKAPTEQDPTGVVFYGNVSVGTYFQTNDAAMFREGVSPMFPKRGATLNHLSFGVYQTSIASILGIKGGGLNLGPLKALFYLELDFVGRGGSTATLGAKTGETSLLRIRHSYLKLNYNHWNLSLGQTWNLFFTSKALILPKIRNAYVFTPHMPHSREHQIKIDFDLLKNVHLAVSLGGLAYQYAYGDAGGSGFAQYGSHVKAGGDINAALEFINIGPLTVHSALHIDRQKLGNWIPNMTGEKRLTCLAYNLTGLLNIKYLRLLGGYNAGEGGQDFLWFNSGVGVKEGGDSNQAEDYEGKFGANFWISADCEVGPFTTAAFYGQYLNQDFHPKAFDDLRTIIGTISYAPTSKLSTGLEVIYQYAHFLSTETADEENGNYLRFGIDLGYSF